MAAQTPDASSGRETLTSISPTRSVLRSSVTRPFSPYNLPVRATSYISCRVPSGGQERVIVASALLSHTRAADAQRTICPPSPSCRVLRGPPPKPRRRSPCHSAFCTFLKRRWGGRGGMSIPGYRCMLCRYIESLFRDRIVVSSREPLRPSRSPRSLRASFAVSRPRPALCPVPGSSCPPPSSRCASSCLCSPSWPWPPPRPPRPPPPRSAPPRPVVALPTALRRSMRPRSGLAPVSSIQCFYCPFSIRSPSLDTRCSSFLSFWPGCAPGSTSRPPPVLGHC